MPQSPLDPLLAFLRVHLNCQLHLQTEVGRAQGLAEGLLLALEGCGIQLDVDQQTLILNCDDTDQLRSWFERAEAATNIAEILTGDSREEGRAKGRVKGLAEGLLLFLASSGIQFDEHQRATIENCDDRDQLRRWLDRAARATSIAEILTSND